MTPSEEVQELLKKLQPSEVDWLRHLLQDTDAHGAREPVEFGELLGIVKTPAVCGGSARLVRTRIPIWLLERMRQLGANDVQILADYPTICEADLIQAWAYVASHRDEIEREILENETD